MAPRADVSDESHKAIPNSIMLHPSFYRRSEKPTASADKKAPLAGAVFLLYYAPTL